MVIRKTFFIVPAFNEEENIPTLLESVRDKMEALGRPCHVVLVDDGSRDGTAAVARQHAGKLSLDVLRHEVNAGVRAAFETGFARALALAGPDDVIITQEADNTSDLSVLAAMLARVEAGADVVLASCFAPEGRVVGSTLDRHVLSFVANTLLRTFFPIAGVHTYSSFYRGFRAETLRRAIAAFDGRLMESSGFACMVEMLVRLRRLPVRIVEVPMVLQCDLRRGPSKMARLRTIREYFTLIAREAFRSPTRYRRVRAAFAAVGPSQAESAF